LKVIFTIIHAFKTIINLLYLGQRSKVSIREKGFNRKERTSKQAIADEYCFLFITTHLFTGLKQRPHHIALNISKKYPAYYFCPIYTKDWFENKIKKPLEVKKITPNLDVAYISLIGGDNISIIRTLNLKIMELSIKEVINRSEKDYELILWLYDPRFVGLREKFAGSLCVYDIMDEFTGFPWSPKDIEERERELLRGADVVFAGTKALYDSKKELSERIYFYSCGVDFEHFHNPKMIGAEKANRLQRWGDKVIGYFGTIDLRIDQELLESMAKNHPELTIVMVGPVIGDFSRLEGYDNIIFTGSVDYEELPYYLSRFDVATIPFVLNELTMHINPTKVLEYFAGGKPVVSVAIPDVVKFYGDAVLIADDGEEFEKKVIEALDFPRVKDRIKKGLEKARSYSWEKMVNSLLSKII